MRVSNENNLRLYPMGSQFSNQWEHKIWRFWLRTSIPADLVHLLLEWITYLLLNSDIVNFVWKTDEGGGWWTKSIVLLIFVLWHCFNRWWVRDCWLGQKVLFRVAEIVSFSSRDLSRPNKHDPFRLVLSTG